MTEPVTEKVVYRGTADLSPAVRADVLAEALPWLLHYRDKIVVVKYGGNAMIDEDLKAAFAADMAFLRTVGAHPIVVHGGGPRDHRDARQGRPRGRVHRRPALHHPGDHGVRPHGSLRQSRTRTRRLINQHGPFAVGTSGEDAGLFTAVKKNTVIDGEEVDLGRVGDIAQVDATVLMDLIDAGRIPVVAPFAPAATDTSKLTSYLSIYTSM